MNPRSRQGGGRVGYQKAVAAGGLLGILVGAPAAPAAAAHNMLVPGTRSTFFHCLLTQC